MDSKLRIASALASVASLLFAAGVEFLALQWQPDIIWVVVPVGTVSLCAFAWFREQPSLSRGELAGIVFIAFNLGLYPAAGGYFAVGAVYFAVGVMTVLVAVEATATLRRACTPRA